MSRYRKIDPRIWKDETYRPLDSLDKLLVLYAITGQSNRVGCFNFSPGMAAEDCGTLPLTFAKRFRNVCQRLSWEWDEQFAVLYLPTWWKYNPPENPNVLKSNLADLDELPNCLTVRRFGANVTHLPETLHETLRVTFAKRLGERWGERMADQEQEQEQEQEQKQEQEKQQGEKAGCGGLDVPPSILERIPSLATWPQVTALVDLWNDHARRHGYPRVTTVSAARRNKAQAALRAFPDWRFWNGAFSHVRLSRFLSGKTPPTNGHNASFRADFDWFLAKNADGIENVVKVDEGRYDDKEYRE